jgi:type II secretory pathway component GspD/PulD (secretin)
MQESSAVEGTLVTFTLRASPFFALETIARANGVALFYENGIWFMRPINEKELVARIYKLKYNPQDNITYTGGQGSSSGSGGGQGGSGGDGGISGLDLTLQQPTSVFQVKAPEMIEQIRKLLGIPSTGVSGAMAGEAGVGEFGAMQTPATVNPAGSNFLPASATAGESGAQAVYNTDANTIYVLATMQQHKWVEGFLSAVDRPQSLIAVEIKFLETSRDPSKELGIDWSETLEGGYGVTAGAEAFAQGGLDTTAISETLDSFGRLATTRNVNGSLTSITTTERENASSNTGLKETGFSGGYAAVLSPDDVTVRLNAFIRDKDTSVVQYPRVLTINNREVAIRSVVNQPVLASTASVDTTGGTGTTAASVEYLPIGTIINVLPKLMPDNSVILNVAITISRIVGFENITLQPGQVQPYPVAASRVYTAALQVNSGYTLAVSGLDESSEESNDSGVPYLKNVPGLGYLFKSKSRDQNKKNLIIFITPTVFGDRGQTEGIATTPDTVVPKRPDDASPPAFTSKGRLVGGAAAVEEALQWLERQVRIFKQMKREGMADKETQRQLKGVIDSANLLVKEIQLLEEQNPANLQTLVDQEGRALKLVSDLNRVKSETRNSIESFGATP